MFMAAVVAHVYVVAYQVIAVPVFASTEKLLCRCVTAGRLVRLAMNALPLSADRALDSRVR
jgi:hypothetical protein